MMELISIISQIKNLLIKKSMTQMLMQQAPPTKKKVWAEIRVDLIKIPLNTGKRNQNTKTVFLNDQKHKMHKVRLQYTMFVFFQNDVDKFCFEDILMLMLISFMIIM